MGNFSLLWIVYCDKCVTTAKLLVYGYLSPMIKYFKHAEWCISYKGEGRESKLLNFKIPSVSFLCSIRTTLALDLI